ncbi:MAG: ATP-binding protein [Bacteroidales bacterium]|nr:ATP-binding protein [Bacteroidales bacterium]
MVDTTLLQYMQEQLALVSTEFKRYKYSQIEWDLRLVGLVGPRGVGKSTMVMQHILETQGQEKALYVSADHGYFSDHTLAELADDFVKEGGDHLYIDEVHKYEGWSRAIKQIYDTHPTLKVMYTGSSVLDILAGEADLSRRVVQYSMQGLSFREYLEFFHGIKTHVRTLTEVIQGQGLSIEGVQHPLPYFAEYLKTGYYPFAKEGAFFTRLDQIITQTTEYDIPRFANMSFSTGRKLHRLLVILSQTVPLKPEYTSLSNAIKASRNDIPDFLLLLERAQVIGQLRDETGGIRGLGKIEKVYLDNTNLMAALMNDKTEIGTVRETFFYNQTRVVADVISSKDSDFCINEYTFEVGGKNKKRKQIADIPNGYVVKDNIEFASDGVIPLWAFGLLY